MGKIITISNQKGGVGKTTTAVNLCSSLAVAEKRVLLVDFDPQGNATSGVGGKTGATTIYEFLLGNAILSEAVQGTELPYLQLLAADRRLAGAEVELVGMSKRGASPAGRRWRRRGTVTTSSSSTRRRASGSSP